MDKYIALLRGINVSGKNKISMQDLKSTFVEMGFLDVMTYINSGNVIFSSDTPDKNELIRKIEAQIERHFNLSIPITVISAIELKDILKNAPKWWDTDDKGIYDNAIFVIPPTKIEEVFEAVGTAKQEIEKVESYRDVIFWSASLKNFNKARWSKIASSAVNNKVTIRNANTTKKLLELAEK